jgi:hypothetical protein
VFVGVEEQHARWAVAIYMLEWDRLRKEEVDEHVFLQMMRLCVCVCVCVCVYAYVSVNACVYVDVCLYLYVRKHAQETGRDVQNRVE